MCGGARGGVCASGEGDEEEGKEVEEGKKHNIKGSEKKINENIKGARILGVYILIEAQTTCIPIEAKKNDAYFPT